jgi:hypothetical protein
VFNSQILITKKNNYLQNIKMNIKDKLNRFDLLFLLLRFCSEKGRYFTAGERICINQERALLIRDNYDIENHNYKYSKDLSEKIEFVIYRINQTNYVPIEEI